VTRFRNQKQFHDKVAVPLVQFQLEYEWGCITYDDGKETRNPPVSEKLYTENPDLHNDPDLRVQHKQWSKLVEVKTESPTHHNFAIHIDCWEAHKRLNLQWRQTLTAFVTLDGKILCGWPDEIPDPQVILVPKRGNWQATEKRLKADYPDSKVIAIAFNANDQSGTPFFTIQKSAPFLKPIDDFIAVELMGWPEDWRDIAEQDDWEAYHNDLCVRCGTPRCGSPACMACGYGAA
jgi:hypothetical protein